MAVGVLLPRKKYEALLPLKYLARLRQSRDTAGKAMMSEELLAVFIMPLFG